MFEIPVHSGEFTEQMAIVSEEVKFTPSHSQIGKRGKKTYLLRMSGEIGGKIPRLIRVIWCCVSYSQRQLH